MNLNKLFFINRLYDFIALRDNRYIELESIENIEAINRKKSRYKSCFWFILPMVFIGIAGIVGCGLFPALAPIFLSITAGAIFDGLSQAFFLGFEHSFLNRKLCPFTLTSTFLMILSWAESALAAILSPLVAPYYFFCKEKQFDDIVNGRAAVGRFVGTALVTTAAIVFSLGLLVANPFTGLPLLGLVAAISTAIAVGFLIIKTCEFIGKLSGAFRTKNLLNDGIEVAKLPGENDNDPSSSLRSSAEIRNKIFNTLFEPIDPRNRKVGATVLRKSSGSFLSQISLQSYQQKFNTLDSLQSVTVHQLTSLQKQKKDTSLETEDGLNNLETYGLKRKQK